MTVPTAVLGGSGFLGGELIRLLGEHPAFELAAVGARSAAGEAVASIHPHLRDCRQRFQDLDPEAVVAQARLAFLATPAAVSARLAPALLERGIETVVDLSPAYRVRDAEQHRRWYPAVDRDGGLAASAVYGLPELSRVGLANASLIAAPGCFATATTLALLALRLLPGADAERIVVDAKSGSTGSGARPRPSGMHPLRTQVIRPYAPAGHRHVAEIQQSLRSAGVVSGAAARLGMSAYSVDAVRGLLSCAYVFCDGELSSADVRRAVVSTFAEEPFVRGVGPGMAASPLPDPRILSGSNFCDVGGFYDADAGRVVLIAALDNMVKGGAGQALQAANIRYGLPEGTGLGGLVVYP